MDYETHVNVRPQSLQALNPPYVAPRNDATAAPEPLGKGRLARRTFLRGVGTALALPCLDAMLPKVVRAAGGAVQASRPCGWPFSSRPTA